MTDQTPTLTTSAPTPTLLPRITIRFCTQCKWMLRAAYYAQELLSTFSTSLGEVALQPSTGGTFVVDITYSNSTINMDNQNQTPTDPEIQTKTLWDRKTDGGFPETKELKRRVRDVIQPDRNLGHVDRDYGSNKSAATEAAPACSSKSGAGKTECADCDNLTEETYRDDEGGHSFGVGDGSGQQTKTEKTESVGAGGSGGKEQESGEKKAAGTDWMSEETYQDLEQ
ncbi:Rdx family-domain-containing protein [Sordaria sp. MPI-SDFR-AT-0083]|nr:Rdx family-domain-containing protein [Sordaria sp. MPI-SDFR-AT-0083]